VTEEMQNIINALIEELPIEKIYLFGSHAYGTPTDDSDYDFYVLIPNGGIKYWTFFFTINPVQYRINKRPNHISYQ
jgi:predicted nucleotidyltransferase